jgi:hypothetical protein
MSFNPYDQARQDARAGNILTPGADPSTYWAERSAVIANQQMKREQERREQEPPVVPGGTDWSQAPVPSPSTPMSPEQAQAGLIGCLVLPAVAALAPVYFAVYPLTAILGIAAGYVVWQVSQARSPGGSFLTGLLVLSATLAGVFVASRVEQRLERFPLYRTVRLPFRLLGFGMVLITALAATGRTAGCLLPDPDSVTMAELGALLRGYYGCVLSDSTNIALVAAAALAFTVAAMVPQIRMKWHEGLQRLRLRTAR